MDRISTALAAALVLASTAPVLAQGERGAGPVTFTAEQERAGSVLFNRECVGCHDGSDAPVLTEREVWGHWAGRPAYRLFDFIAHFMPGDRPGILSREQYVLAMAHLLSLNGAVASDVPLMDDVESLRRLILPLAPLPGAPPR